MTRLELSLHFDRDLNYSGFEALNQQEFPETIAQIMSKITRAVLGHKPVREHMLRQINTMELLESLGQLPTNALIIGWNYCYLINAVTSHTGHYIGTRRKIALTSKGADVATWNKISQLVLRFAGIGSQV